MPDEDGGQAPSDSDDGGQGDESGTPPTPPAAAAEDESQLGEAGKRALDAERARTAAEREAKAAKAEAEQLRKRHQSEEEKAIEAAKAEGRREVEDAANARIVRAEVTAAGGGLLADPTDAARYLDLKQFDVAEDGSVDRKAMASAIESLVKDKPYLAAKPSKPTGDAGNGPQGDAAEGQSMDSWIRERARHG